MKTKVTGAFRRASGERGAAMVELAVLMLALLPMILLPLYFQDAMFYKLNLQERVFTTAWDFAFADYNKNTPDAISNDILAENDFIFRNGWSGNMREKPNPAGPWADFRWPSNPVSCSLSQHNGDFKTCKDMPLVGGGLGGFLLCQQFAGATEYNKGGLVECEGKIEIANYYMPENVRMLTSKPEFFKEKGRFIEYNDGDRPLRFGVLVDPWTIHNPKSISHSDKGANKEFFERVEFMWKKPLTYITFMIGFYGFYFQAMSLQLLSPAIIGMDNPTKLDLSAIHPVDKLLPLEGGAGLGGKREFWVSPYEDGDQDIYKETYQVRKFSYLGCKKALETGNCE